MATAGRPSAWYPLQHLEKCLLICPKAGLKQSLTHLAQNKPTWMCTEQPSDVMKNDRSQKPGMKEAGGGTWARLPCAALMSQGDARCYSHRGTAALVHCTSIPAPYPHQSRSQRQGLDTPSPYHSLL